MHIHQIKNKQRMVINKYWLALVLASAATANFAAGPSVDIKVQGTITPVACTPNISNLGIADFGSITAGSLRADIYNFLPVKTLNYTITCDAQTKIAIQGIDNRASSVIPGAGAALWTLADTEVYGMGSINNKNVGVFFIVMDPDKYTADSQAVKVVGSKDGGTTWANSLGYVGGTRIISWSATAGGAPLAFKSLIGTINIGAALNKSTELPLTGPIPLDGSATLQIKYL